MLRFKLSRHIILLFSLICNAHTLGPSKNELRWFPWYYNNTRSHVTFTPQLLAYIVDRKIEREGVEKTVARSVLRHKWLRMPSKIPTCTLHSDEVSVSIICTRYTRTSDPRNRGVLDFATHFATIREL